MLKEGLEVGKYRLVSLLGKGGRGEVWKAYAPDLRRHVAIKFVFVRGEEDLKRFLREARVAAQLQHPNIAQVYGVEEGNVIVMHRINGPTIDKVNLL